MSDSRTTGHRGDETRDPATLTPHPYALLHFPLGPEGDDSDLVASVGGPEGVLRPLTITGERCFSPPGTVLNGNRRRRASIIGGLETVPVRILDDLTEAEEQRIVLAENLGDQLGRKLTESQRAQLEHELTLCIGKGQGHRSDLTSAGASGSGDTRDQVAVAVAATRNSVADRRTVFFSPVSPASLKRAVDSGAVTRTQAASLVRQAEKLPAVAAALRTNDVHRSNEVIANATAWVEHQLKSGKSRKRGSAKQRSVKSTVVHLSACPVEVELGGRRVRLDVREGQLRLEDLGSPEPRGPFAWPEKDYLVRVTPTNWIHAVHRAVAFFPDDLRADISIDDVVTVPPQHCTGCGGTLFARDSGECATCQPVERGVVVVNHVRPREELTLFIKDGDDDPAALSIAFWESSHEAGLYYERPDCPVVMAGKWPLVANSPRTDLGFKSLRQLCIEVHRALFQLMCETHGVWVFDFKGQPREHYRIDGSKIEWRDLAGWVSSAERDEP